MAAGDVGPEGEAGLEVPEVVLPPRTLLFRGLLRRRQHASPVDVPWQGVAWRCAGWLAWKPVILMDPWRSADPWPGAVPGSPRAHRPRGLQVGFQATGNGFSTPGTQQAFSSVNPAMRLCS